LTENYNSKKKIYKTKKKRSFGLRFSIQKHAVRDNLCVQIRNQHIGSNLRASITLLANVKFNGGTVQFEETTHRLLNGERMQEASYNTALIIFQPIETLEPIVTTGHDHSRKLKHTLMACRDLNRQSQTAYPIRHIPCADISRTKVKYTVLQTPLSV
jgi:hypothetical protein